MYLPTASVLQSSGEKSAGNLTENPFYTMTSKVPDVWRIGSVMPTLASKGCVQAAPGTPAELPAVWLGQGRGEGGAAATVLRTEIDQNQPQFTVQVFPLEVARLQQTPELQRSSNIVPSDRSSQDDCCLNTDSCCLLEHHLPRIVSIIQNTFSLETSSLTHELFRSALFNL